MIRTAKYIITSYHIRTLVSRLLSHHCGGSMMNHDVPPISLSSSCDIQTLAVYGTLRDDDDSGAPWTKQFIKDISGASSGVYEAATLYYQPSLGYPIVVLHEDTATASSPSSSSACTGVHVRLLRWPTPSMFGQQLKEADRIEGYDVATDHGEYVRRRIDVKELHTGAMIPAWIYVKPAKNSIGSDWIVLKSGDWKRRKEEITQHTVIQPLSS